MRRMGKYNNTMAQYINGVIVSKSAPKLVNQERGTYAVEHLMQHEWNNDNPNFNKYIAFTVFGDRDNKRISTLNIQVNEELEVALDINARPMLDRATGQPVVDENGTPRYITSITCFGVERDKSKWHRYERRQRTASGMPIAQRNEAFAQAAANYAATSAPATVPAAASATVPAASAAVYQAPSAPVAPAPAPAPAADNEDLPF